MASKFVLQDRVRRVTRSTALYAGSNDNPGFSHVIQGLKEGAFGSCALKQNRTNATVGG